MFVIFEMTMLDARTVWARADRRPARNMTEHAKDTIQLSYHVDMLCRPASDHLRGDIHITGGGLQFRDMLLLLSAVHETASSYHLYSVNCRFFAETVFQTLHAKIQQSPVFSLDHLATTDEPHVSENFSLMGDELVVLPERWSLRRHITRKDVTQAESRFNSTHKAHTQGGTLVSLCVISLPWYISYNIGMSQSNS